MSPIGNDQGGWHVHAAGRTAGRGVEFLAKGLGDSRDEAKRKERVNGG